MFIAKLLVYLNCLLLLALPILLHRISRAWIWSVGGLEKAISTYSKVLRQPDQLHPFLLHLFAPLDNQRFHSNNAMNNVVFYIFISLFSKKVYNKCTHMYIFPFYRSSQLFRCKKMPQIKASLKINIIKGTPKDLQDQTQSPLKVYLHPSRTSEEISVKARPPIACTTS